MQTLLTQPALQRQTLTLYGELLALHESWAGRLVLCCGAGASTTGLLAAVSIAGGTTLAIDPDLAAVKGVFRDGGLDFLVNTLDEALRTLKNELRKGRPLSVGLVAEPADVLQEMLERGVLPDLFVEMREQPFLKDGLAALFSEGMPVLPLVYDEDELVESERLRLWLGSRGWSAREVGESPVEDVVRRNWGQRIVQYQRSVRGGGCWGWFA